jgi:hypothetical protein
VRRGEIEGEVDALDCVLEKEEDAAGAEVAPAGFGFEVASSVWDKIEQNKNIRRSARAWGGGQRKREGAASPAGVEFDKNGGGTGGFPTRNRSSLAARRAEKKGKTDEGGSGIYRGEVCVEEGLGFARGGNRRAPVRPVLARDSWPEEEDDLTGLAHLSASRREKVPYRFGC